MAFFKNLFGGKDPRSCFDKGNRLLAEGRFAEARGCFDDALERLGGGERFPAGGDCGPEG